MSFKSSVSKILEKKITLHIVFVIALLNLIGYLISGNFHAFIFLLRYGSSFKICVKMPEDPPFPVC